jgi:hypothetical protein
MKKLVIFFGLIAAMACNDDEDKSPSKLQLLTGGSEKAWYISDVSEGEPCPSSTDDSWIFSVDGGFEFQHGTVTESPEEQCSDFINFIGEWEFVNNESQLRVTALYQTDNPANTINDDLFTATITVLDDDWLLLQQAGSAETLEFRAR